MQTAALVFGGIAAALHVVFFLLESVLFEHPGVWPSFVASREDARIVAPMAFNQGFYNLFLAIGGGTGIVLVATGSEDVGTALLAFACACMFGASAVLIATGRRFLRAAAVQGVPPFACLLLLLAA